MEFNATFFVTAISFIVFTFIMNKIFYAPLTKVIDEREDFINKTVAEAKDSTSQAENLLKNKEETLSATVEKSRKIVTSAAEKASSDGEVLTDEAKRQARLKIEDGKINVTKEKEAAQNELKSKVKDLAEIIASKVLQSETRIENVDNELIDRILV
ncbi:ATP synthase F0 subunit B [Candidatus Gastranaerophilales bacterium]|nr:MAG: ATP synthase F0 subunit B [Candidatus Gastranaerophilales bacterium]